MKNALLIILLACAPAHAQYAIVAHTAAGSPDGVNVTTSAINTTGANLIGLCVADYSLGGAYTISDSKGNTWTGLTQKDTGSSARGRIFYSVPSSVGSGHTFTYTGGGGFFPAIAVIALSGSTGSPFDQQNGTTTSAATTLSTGSVTPTQDNEFLLACLSSQASGTVTINSSFTVQDQVNFGGGTNFSVVSAYQMQTTATTRNPQFGNLGANDGAAEIATFKAATTTSSQGAAEKGVGK